MVMSGSFFASASGQNLLSDSVPDDHAVIEPLTASAAEQIRKEQLEAFARMFTFRFFEGKATDEDWQRLADCIRRDPSSETLLGFCLTALRKSPAPDSGIRTLRTLASEFPDSALLNLAAGDILINRRKPQEALPFLKQAFERLLQKPSAIPGLKQRHAILSRYLMTLFFEQKEDELNRAKELLESAPYREEFSAAAEVLLLVQAARLEKESAEPLTFFGPVRSRTLALRRELDRCIDRYFDTREKNPDLPLDGQLTTRIIVSAGQGDRLLNALHMEYLETGKPGLLPALAGISELMNRNMTAVRYLEQYLTSAGTLPSLPVVNRIADLLHAEGQDARAAEILDRYAKKLPAHPSLILRQIEIFSALRDWNRAFEAACAFPAGFDRSYFQSVILQEQGRIREAYAAARKAREYAAATKKKFRDHSFFYHFCTLAEKCGDVTSVDRILSELIKSSPDDPLLLNFLGYTLADHEKDLKRAEALISKAVKLDPESGAILDSMAWVLYRLKRFAEAKKYILKAIAKSGEDLDAVIMDHAGDIFSANGDTADAVMYWEKALELPGEADRERIRMKLKNAGNQNP